jgi:hypothetical protein|tara:strand:- start:269 stop:865 length:597 start_codon:yes stop_codon:yes gene_type:complete
VVRIDVFDYIKDLSNAKSETKSFEETKKDLEGLYEYDIILEELENSNFFAPENSIYINYDTLMQARSIISEIKEKQEIKDRLNSLSYSIGWLKTSVLIKDKDIANKAIGSIIKNNYSSISTIVSELNNLKSKIDELEYLHISLLKSGLSLDIKTLLEQDFKEKHKKLNDLYNKQKSILLNLSSIFVRLTKENMLKKRR